VLLNRRQRRIVNPEGARTDMTEGFDEQR
jgi:hypothetical protein